MNPCVFSTVNPKKFSKFFLGLPWIFAALVFFGVFNTASAQNSATLTIGAYKITAEVANTAYLRQKGLMNRLYLPQNQGMIFIFPQAMTHCMWMKNTPLDLSVAFIDDLGRIINIEQMQANTTNAHCAKMPARYALEMKAGFFKNRNIIPRMKINGLNKLPRAY